MGESTVRDIDFESITPDMRNDWLNQPDSDFGRLIPLANRRTKFAKNRDEEDALFGVYSVGISTNRDEWVYDFDHEKLLEKVGYFTQVYEDDLERFSAEEPDANSIGGWVNRSIKWTTELEQHLVRQNHIQFAEKHIVPALYRPFLPKSCYYAPLIIHRRYQMPQLFPHDSLAENKVICFPGNSGGKDFQALATDRLFSHDLLKTTQCLPLYRYTEDGERVSNITRWGIEHITRWGHQRALPAGVGRRVRVPDRTVRHHRRGDFRLHLRRAPQPRLPPRIRRRPAEGVSPPAPVPGLSPLGQDGPEAAGPAHRVRVRRAVPAGAPRPSRTRWRTTVDPKRAILRADKERGTITLDERTTLAGIPAQAWEYRLGNRSALEWVLDQYKERKPRDPTIREKFNTYRFSDHKERVIDLLRRVCTVSVATMEIVDSMAHRELEERRGQAPGHGV